MLAYANSKIYYFSRKNTCVDLIFLIYLDICNLCFSLSAVLTNYGSSRPDQTYLKYIAFLENISVEV